jgi:hypothetical protein
MSIKGSFLLSGACIAVVTCATSAVLITLASIKSQPASTQIGKTANTVFRNRYLQPEALRVSRRLGKRFTSSVATASSIAATVTIAGNEQPVTITRRQQETSETVELGLAARLLTWTANDGTKTASGTPTDEERLLLERLTYDSPDYFVLAQLRGASYFTVARNVRPEKAADSYDGPLWTIVRVDDPQSDQTLRPKSSWRLYYINSQTGLIDRIVSQLGDETVEAEISAWTEVSGEKVPSSITWSSSGRILMTYQLSSFSRSE